MMNCRQKRAPRLRLDAVFGLTGALAVAVMMAIAGPRPADALQSYTQQTGLSCGRCHANPAGGGKLTSFGIAFAGNGHKVPAKGAKSDKKNAPAEVTPAVEPAAEIVPGRALDYIPWTLRDPYYSHFLYKSDDYRD